MTQKVVFLCCPSYGGLSGAAVMSLMKASKDPTHRVYYRLRKPCSLLAMEFNAFWTEALNDRKNLGITHFAMQHADVHGEDFWLDKMLLEQERVGADILSAVIPIKDDRQLTSTAVYDLKNKSFTRLTLQEVWDHPEPTFDIHTWWDADGLKQTSGRHLCLNTGLWVCDFTQPWVEKVHFEICDQIAKMPDGHFEPINLSEDWHFSVQAAREGVSLFATRAIKVKHGGVAEWPNFPPFNKGCGNLTENEP